MYANKKSLNGNELLFFYYNFFTGMYHFLLRYLDILLKTNILFCHHFLLLVFSNAYMEALMLCALVKATRV